MISPGNKLICDHCGDDCRDDSIYIDDKIFCCNGCKTVHQLLNDSELKELYAQINSGTSVKSKFNSGEFDFLDDRRIIESLLDYEIDDKSKVTFYLPQIYCSACLYLIENISRLNSGIIESRVDFLRKEVSIVFKNKETNIRAIVELLTSIGYKPQLNLSDIDKPRKASDNRSLYIKLGIAGFCFGNVMLMALPEYFSGGDLEPVVKTFFQSINILFGIMILYSSSGYFKSALTSLKVKHISIDVPISLGILVLFLRSVWDISLGIGPGYIDSLTGLVFFMLTGKVFQQKTYYNLSFDRNFKSYFPLSVLRIKNGQESQVPVVDIGIGDRLVIRANEIIPADSILIHGHAEIDYSFVTGESRPLYPNPGDKIFAGGKQLQGSITVETVKSFNQSYLTELWNRDVFRKQGSPHLDNITNKVAGYFTIIVLIIALVGFVVWLFFDINKAFHALTSVLIVACPCALALTVPFTLGTALRVYSKNKFYLKNDHVIEKLADIDTIVFDKTGTLTFHNESNIQFIGDELSKDEQILVKSAAINSTHPLSRIIASKISYKNRETESYNEIPGKGIIAQIDGNQIMLGSRKWVTNENMILSEKNINSFQNESAVFVSINNKYRGYFSISSKLRDGIGDIFSKLKRNFKLSILSGDNDSERDSLSNVIGTDVEMNFNQLPEDKIAFIEKTKNNGSKILMIGDGLNDIGALQTADLGIAVTENTANFTPGSDGIIESESLKKLPDLIFFAKKAKKTIKISFFISFLYNIVGFSYALTGQLEPVVAAILMPVSSVSVIALTVFRVKFDAYKLKL